MLLHLVRDQILLQTQIHLVDSLDAAQFHGSLDLVELPDAGIVDVFSHAVGGHLSSDRQTVVGIGH